MFHVTYTFEKVPYGSNDKTILKLSLYNYRSGSQCLQSQNRKRDEKFRKLALRKEIIVEQFKNAQEYKWLVNREIRNFNK